MELFIFIILGIFLCLVFAALGFLFAKGKLSNDSKALIQEKSKTTFLIEEKVKLLKEIQLQQEKIINLEKNLSREVTQKETFLKELETQKQFIENMREKLKLEFEKLARDIFSKETETYKKRSEESLSSLLNPLKEKISDFKKQVADFYEKEGKERHSLDAAVKSLVQAHQKTTEETAQLTQALKGSAKVQGDWGEIVLKRILEASGLNEGEEFTLQGKGLEMKTEEGNPLKPDVVVHLPDNRDIVIDSKVSLIHYYNYTEAKTEQEKEECIRQIISSLAQHIKNLSEKSYSGSDKLNTPDFTFMFIPLESVFSLALSRDQSLFEKAWKQSIIIVTPTNLLATLKTVSSIWKLEKQNKNVRQIAAESGKMYEKFIGFLHDMKDIEKGLNTARQSYDGALNKLKYGKGNLIGRAEKIKQLGARSEKELPLAFLSDSSKN